MTLKDFRNIIFIIMGSILVTVILPGIIAQLTGTFYKEDLVSKIPTDKVKSYKDHEDDLKKFNRGLFAIDTMISKKLANPGDIKINEVLGLITLREKIIKNSSVKNAPINLIPFYLNPQMLLWFGIYSALGLLIYLINKKSNICLRFITPFLFGCLLYLFYEWPLWLRNFILNQTGRTVFAYPNFDIDKCSFAYQ
jgi:hypothetical protein